MAASRHRRKHGGATAWVDLIARLPWWGGLVLAALSYALLQRWATGLGPVPAYQPGQILPLLLHGLQAGMAPLLQYLVPGLCLFAAAVSALRGRKRRALAQQAAAEQGAGQALLGMSWREFEQLVGEAFRQRGYQVSETGGGGPDGGIDLVLRKGGETLLVQCKQWRATTVGVDVVRALYGLVTAEGATGGIVVSAGRYSRDALAFAEGRNLQLIDGPTLHGWLRQHTKPRPPAPKPETARQTTPRPQPPAATPSSPACPQCGQAMKRRMAKQGANAGREFWGCSGYPQCRGTRGIDEG